MHMPHRVRHFTGIGIAVLAALAFSASGCATKKYVRAQVAPIEQKVGTLEGQTKENEKGLDELSTRVSRVDERALTADQKAEEAGRQTSQPACAERKISRRASKCRCRWNHETDQPARQLSNGCGEHRAVRL